MYLRHLDGVYGVGSKTKKKYSGHVHGNKGTWTSATVWLLCDKYVGNAALRVNWPLDCYVMKHACPTWDEPLIPNIPTALNWAQYWYKFKSKIPVTAVISTSVPTLCVHTKQDQIFNFAQQLDHKYFKC